METMRQQLTDEQGRTAPRLSRPAAGEHAAPASDPRVMALVERAVELEVIPRLLLARRTQAALERHHAGPAVPAITGEQVGQLVRLLLAHDEAVSISYVMALHKAAIPAETLHLDLLAPAARQLGQMWMDDDCDFTDVTIGLLMLQNALRELGSAPGNAAPIDSNALRALLVPLPGEQHTFGLTMVADFFRRAGWHAWSAPVESDSDLATMVAHGWFDVVGFSLLCDEHLDAARRAIELVRRVSLNPDVVVLVGGAGFIADPTLAVSIGADGTATDGLGAVQQAGALVARIASRRCA